MTRDDIIRIAREADLPIAWISEKGVLRWSELERFAALVAAAERESLTVAELRAALVGVELVDEDAIDDPDDAGVTLEGIDALHKWLKERSRT